MNLRCHTCGRLHPDTEVQTVGRNDLGDDVYACSDCRVPPHTRARSTRTDVPRFGAIPRW